MAAGAQVIQFPSKPAVDEPPRKSLQKLKDQFTDAIASKWDENAESAEAERYFHGVQWTSEQLKILKDRGQPPVTFNRVKRKINTICGIIEKLKQDPKAYARNPQRQAEDGAEIATKVLNYAIGWDWNTRSSTVARRCAIRGLSGMELVLVGGDQGDPEIEWDLVDQRDFFYDPRSCKLDFSDARFLGTTRWVDLDEAVEAWPDYAEDLESYVDHGAVNDHERGDERRDLSWISKRDKKVRLVEHWYQVGSDWHYAIYCGEHLLEHGPSYLKDEKGRSCHKYELLSYEVDQDGDRYGAIRDLKSAQDEVNQRRSKALHQISSRKIIADAGAVDDVELARREYARADGWVVKNPGKEVIPEDVAAKAVVEGNLQMLAEAKLEIDSYGPNPSLIGSEVAADSGRAIQLLQAAGIAELGSFMQGYKQWKLRVYRKTWNTCQQVWTAPRWIRVTDDENLSQFVEVNGWEQDPVTGQVQVLNQLASLDVDVIIDEGNDYISSMTDVFDTLVALGKGGAQVPPEMFIEMSPLPSSTKQRIMQQIAQAQQPKPMDQMAMQLQLGMLQAQIGELQSKTALNTAKVQSEGVRAQADLIEAQTQPPPQVDTPADLAKANLDAARAREIDHKINVGTHMPQIQPTPPPPPPEPGLFELNTAKAQRELAAAEQAKLSGWAQHDQTLADIDLKQAQTGKVLEEIATIQQAPPGMLQTPPPRPPPAGGRGGAR